METPTHYAPILGLFDRTRSTFGAVRALLRDSFVHEAVLLGRPLFTESLMLAELASANELRRIELVVGWWLKSLDDFDGNYRAAEALGDDVHEDQARLAKRRSEVESYARQRGARTRHWKIDEKKLAHAHGRSREYIDFGLTHHFVHGSALVSEQRSSTRGEVLVVGGPAAELEVWANPAGLFGAISLLHACKSVCEIFEWPEPSEIEDFQQRAEKLAEAELERG